MLKNFVWGGIIFSNNETFVTYGKGKIMKKSNKTLVLSALAALAFGAGAVGSTFALFTSQAETNVTVTTGKVDVKASASDLKTYSLDKEMDEGKFENGGTATINGTSIILSNVTPGDKVAFSVSIKNNSTVKTKYRISVLKDQDTGLFNGLNFSIAGMTSSSIGQWEALEVGSADILYEDCYIELPKEAGNEYQGKSCVITFKVEAVQDNADVDENTIVVNDTAEAQAALNKSVSGKTIYFKSGNYDELFIYPTKDTASETEYYNGGDIWNKNWLIDVDNLTSTGTHAYKRILTDVTFIGESDVTIKTITAKYAFGSVAGAIDPVTGQTVDAEKSNAFGCYIEYKGITFKNISFTEQVYLGNWEFNPKHFIVSEIDIQNCNFYSASDYALQLGAYYGVSLGNVTIKNSTFTAPTYAKCGIYIKNTTGNFDIENNIFTNCGYNAIQLTEDGNHVSTYPDVSTTLPDMTMTLKGNVFEDIESRPLRLGATFASAAKAVVEGNIFYSPTNKIKPDNADTNFIKSSATNLTVSIGENTYYDSNKEEIKGLTVASDTNKTYFNGCVDKA